MGRMEELFYELYASSKQHDSRQRYAMIVELRALMKQPIRGSSGSVHSERYGDDRRFGGGQFRDGADDDDDALPYSSQLSDSPAIRSKQLDELHLWLRSNNAKRENRQVDAELEEESIPQFQVPVSDSEIVRSIEPGKVDLGLGNKEYVVLNENLEQEWVQKKVKTSFEADGDAGKGQKMISDAYTCCAHKVFVKMPSKVKRIKHLKAWKFKFKSTSKRSRLMDSKFSFVDAFVLLNKDSLETIWDCVKKEFKETMVACGKNRVDRIQLVQATPRPGVYGRPLQTRVWDSGGSLLESVDEEYLGDDRSREVITEFNSYTGLTHLDKSDFRRFDDDKIKEWLFKVEEFFSIDFTLMELKVKLASNHFEGQLLRQFQELFEKLSLASMVFEQTFSSITEPKKILPSFFRLKHKWRSRLSHSFAEMKQRMIGRVWKSFGYLMEDMMEEDQKQQGDSEPLVIVPGFDAKVCVTFDQYIRRKGSVGADHETKNNQPTLTFLRSTKQSYLSLRDNRVWDPGGSFSRRCHSMSTFSSLYNSSLHYSYIIFLKKKTLRSRFLQRREICYRKWTWAGSREDGPRKMGLK